MNNSILKLGTPTKYGYRTSKGFTRKGDRLVQQVFWLGSDPALALKKLSLVEQAAAGVERDECGRVIWGGEAGPLTTPPSEDADRSPTDS